MILEIVTAVSGTAIGSFVGHINGYFVGRKVKALDFQTMFPDVSTSALWCLCSDPVSMHKDKTGPCRAISHVKQKKYSHAAGEYITHTTTAACTCQVFVGDPDRNPTPKGELEL